MRPRSRWPLWALAFAFAACSAQQSDAVLRFLFDGVPPLAGEAEPLGPPVPVALPHGLSLDERAALQRERLEPVDRSFHPPFRDKQCERCHAIQRTDTWLQGTPELVAPKEQLCGRCHAPPAVANVHGPVATTSCGQCHEHHTSTHPHLLKAVPPDLCLQCHQGETFVTQVAHAAYGEQSCIACHDPHGSGRQFLLRDARPAAVRTIAPGAERRGD